MHTDSENPDPLIELGYEQRDISVPQIRTSVIGFFLFAILSAALAAGFMVLVQPKFWSNDQPKSAFTRQTPPPPYPILQNNITAKTDIEELRKKEKLELASTAWTDEQKRHLKIPIDRAIDIIVKRGLPKTTGNVSPAAARAQERPASATQQSAPEVPAASTAAKRQ